MGRKRAAGTVEKERENYVDLEKTSYHNGNFRIYVWQMCCVWNKSDWYGIFFVHVWT